MKRTLTNGILLLFTIFGIMCICIFSSMSFILARNNYSLSNKYLESTRDYYNADYKACEQLKDNNIRNDEFEVEIDDLRTLNVKIKNNEIVTWKVIFTGDWEIDNIRLYGEGEYASNFE